MVAPKVFFVHLRRPDKSNPEEQRDDPFYEYGSFGCTGCHSKNLLHQRNSAKLEGARLAFVQGGKEGSRLVFLTPCITIKVRNDICEAKWKPRDMPFKYCAAPILIRNDGSSDFETIRHFVLSKKNSQTFESRFASLLRSRTRPISDVSAQMMKEVIAVYERKRGKAIRRDEKNGESTIAEKYYQALPYDPPKIDCNRKTTYQRFLRELTGRSQSRCRKPPCREPGD